MVDGKDYSKPFKFNDPINSSVDDLNYEEFVEVCPNPVKNDLYINFDLAEPTRYKLEIYDILGRKVLDRTDLELSKTINLSDFNQGIYYLKIIDKENKNSFYYKIVKQ